jgi:hypothetical protein
MDARVMLSFWMSRFSLASMACGAKQAEIQAENNRTI